MVSYSRHKCSPRPENLVSNWCQRPPIGPVLPVLPSNNPLSVNYLGFWYFHGMEEVIGSIPIRSTNSLKHLALAPFRDFVASLSQIPKPLHELASQALPKPEWCSLESP